MFSNAARPAPARTGAWPSASATAAGRMLGGHPGPEVLRRVKQLSGHEPADGGVLMEMIAACARLRANIDGVEAEIVQRLSRVHPGNALAEELAARLAITTGVADRLTGRAAALRDYIEVHFALLGGDIDARKAEVFIEATATLPDVQARAIHRALLPDAPGLTTGQLRNRLRAAVLAVDADLAHDRHQRAATERHVSVSAADDGMALLTFYLPATDAAAAMVALDALATKTGPDDERTIGARRVDAFAQIINQILASGHAPDGTPMPTQQGKRPHLVFTIAQSTLDGEDDAPGYLAGHGPLPADIIRQLASTSENRTQDTASSGTGQGEEDGQADTEDNGAAPNEDDPAQTASDPVDRVAALRSRPDSTVKDVRTHARTGTLLPPKANTGRPVRGAFGIVPGAQNPSAQNPSGNGECDPVQALASYGILATDSYQPDAQLREFILTRDVTCRFPTCRQPARRCQIDHITPFDPTKAAWTQTHQGNLHLLCARHHQLKTDGHWKVGRDQHTGDTHWSSPLGYQYTRTAEIIDPTHHLSALHHTLAAIRAESADQPALLNARAPLEPGIVSEEELAELRCRGWPHHRTTDTGESMSDYRIPLGPSVHPCICADYSSDINDILNRLRPPPKDPEPSSYWTDSDPPPF